MHKYPLQLLVLMSIGRGMPNTVAQRVRLIMSTCRSSFCLVLFAAFLLPRCCCRCCSCCCCCSSTSESTMWSSRIDEGATLQIIIRILDGVPSLLDQIYNPVHGLDDKLGVSGENVSDNLPKTRNGHFRIAVDIISLMFLRYLAFRIYAKFQLWFWSCKNEYRIPIWRACRWSVLVIVSRVWLTTQGEEWEIINYCTPKNGNRRWMSYSLTKAMPVLCVRYYYIHRQNTGSHRAHIIY